VHNRVRFSSFFLLTTLVLTALLVSGEGTRTWEQNKYDDFSKGTSHGVSMSSNGFLLLAPAFKLVATTPSSAVWATAVAPNGDIFLATGAPARVYRVTGGQPAAIFQPQELQVQALVVDKHGVIYAATNPDGKVYRLERASSAQASASPSQRSQEAKGESEPSNRETGWKSSAYQVHLGPGSR
jgi:hypothetical protein